MKTLHTFFSHNEFHNQSTGSKLNRLRAGVLGANDGIVSTASLILGVAGASNSSSFILTAGIAGMVAGALSMAVGEYVSVSSQRDSERALLEKERFELSNNPVAELAELATIYEGKGLSKETAKIVAAELSAGDVFAAHVDAELGINPNDLANPWHAAYASVGAFVCGALIPILAVALPSPSFRIPITFISVIIALVITGSLSAYVGGANKTHATIRVVVGGVLAMIVTYGIGRAFGVVGL